jgi:hypothetical protein
MWIRKVKLEIIRKNKRRFIYFSKEIKEEYDMSEILNTFEKEIPHSANLVVDGGKWNFSN